MDSIFKKPKLKKQTSRNAFDVSQKRVQHAPFGAILPCFCRVLAPDDYVELSAESQFICDSLARPAFIRLKEHINFYAVKMRSLWAPFDNFITGQDNYNSVAVKAYQGKSVPDRLPVITNLTSHLRLLSQKTDVFGINEAYNAMRLLDLLEYGNFFPYFNANQTAGVLDDDAPEITRDFNPFALAAYQKVYYDYYRNPKYEECNVNAFNFDNIDGGDAVSQPLNFLKMHYAWAKKDYFTDVQPSVLPSSSDIGFEDLTNVAPDTSIFGVPGASSSTIISTVQGGQSPQGFTSNTGEFVESGAGSTSPYSVQSNVTALRFAFAYDKLLRRMREAGGTFDKQMLAQFGIKPYEGRDGKCTFIGGQTNRLNASDVIAQSGSAQNSLGFIGGNINQYSAPRSTFKYHATEYTIVIGMYHTSLDYDYPSYATSRFNQYMNRFDYFNPAFENLGLQPLYKFELMNLPLDNANDWRIEEPWLSDTQDENTEVLGYVRRYAECKTSVDKVFGLFDFGISADNNAWVSQFHPIKQTNDGDELPIQIKPLNSIALRFNPHMFNQVVTTNYNGDWFTDPFKNHFYIHCKLIGNMSPLGESF